LARLLPTAFLVALLATATGAFALTEGANVERSPVFAAFATGAFSPGLSTADVDFRLRKADRVTVWMTRDGRRVATIVPGHTYPAGPVRVEFGGITSTGLTLPQGTYVPVVHLDRAHRTVTLPTPIRLDTSPPSITVPHRVYTHISPDGDRRRDVFRAPFSLDGPAHAILTVRGRTVDVTAIGRRRGVLAWNGRLDGRVVRPGNYVLRAAARDASGNTSRPFAFAVVTVRYVRLGRNRVVTRPRERFAILVLADAPRVSWLFARGRGVAATGRGHTTLRLRAPRKPGVYRLYVTASGHSAKALVVVA
jgi:hypothetical protein